MTSRAWTVAALAALAPLLVLLAWTFWRMPYPINEAVAIFEDVARKPPQQFLIADTTYYRPLYHLSVMARDETLTHGRTVLVSPLMWAVAQRQRNIVGELLAFGAHVDRSTNRMAPCVADAIGDADLADLLRKYPGATVAEKWPAWTR